MSSRISIQALREWAWQNGDPAHPDLIEGSRVLALVEAVEAAQRLRDATWDPETVDNWTIDLDAALARFDFGEQP